ncbi:sigma-70 family RNA polymerase sigma factor [Salinicoccus albus]|uniref:sigma-70 family RNA polymerase sigma factor n=1 Tax=Salinicoccus albus TaxID=418756 RepID=UPI0003671889|nr:sigma-70 family RNA polymerase sigma factor [Salinicoccus albus]
MISVLIMDVSGSSRAGEEVFEHLSWLEKEISTWVSDEDFFHVDYRMGDELFILSSTRHYTLFIAIYAKLLWPDNDFPLKCSYISADTEPPEGDPEQWSSQEIKDTRSALDEIKKSAIQDFASPGMTDEIDVATMYLTDILNGMTPLQQEVASLRLGGMRQKDISLMLDKNESTISAHYRKSRGRQLERILSFLVQYHDTDIDKLNEKFTASFNRRLES